MMPEDTAQTEPEFVDRKVGCIDNVLPGKLALECTGMVRIGATLYMAFTPLNANARVRNVPLVFAFDDGAVEREDPCRFATPFEVQGSLKSLHVCPIPGSQSVLAVSNGSATFTLFSPTGKTLGGRVFSEFPCGICPRTGVVVSEDSQCLVLSDFMTGRVLVFGYDLHPRFDDVTALFDGDDIVACGVSGNRFQVVVADSLLQQKAVLSLPLPLHKQVPCVAVHNGHLFCAWNARKLGVPPVVDMYRLTDGELVRFWTIPGAIRADLHSCDGALHAVYVDAAGTHLRTYMNLGPDDVEVLGAGQGELICVPPWRLHLSGFVALETMRRTAYDLPD